jgi:hypothetical protein
LVEVDIMALNPFFLQGSPSEQNLIQDLINEQLRMYGVEVHYMPRKFITENTVIREVIESNFDEAHPIEAYLENFEGYGDQTTILSKFGIQSTQEISLTISKERFESYLTPLMEGKDNIKISNRPKEGDLIYFPLGDRLFEIKFVEHEKPFYQLQKGYVYTLKCELFRYENEVIDTDVSEIDDAIQGTLGSSDSELLGGDAMTTTLKLVGVGTTALATVGYVSDGGIRMISVTNRGGGYTYNPDVKISIAPAGGTTGVATAERISGIVACELNANPVAESIQKVLLTNPGAGYTLAPAVRFAGDGVGAAATASIGDGVIGIVTITGGGSGYTTATAPVVTFSGSATVSAAATVRVSSAGTIHHQCWFGIHGGTNNHHRGTKPNWSWNIPEERNCYWFFFGNHSKSSQLGCVYRVSRNLQSRRRFCRWRANRWSGFFRKLQTFFFFLPRNWIHGK